MHSYFAFCVVPTYRFRAICIALPSYVVARSGARMCVGINDLENEDTVLRGLFGMRPRMSDIGGKWSSRGT